MVVESRNTIEEAERARNSRWSEKNRFVKVSSNRIGDQGWTQVGHGRWSCKDADELRRKQAVRLTKRAEESNKTPVYE